MLTTKSLTIKETFIERRVTITYVETTEIREKCVFIKITRSGNPQGMPPEALYNATRKEWRAAINHIQECEYVMAIYENRVVEVYRPLEWFVNVRSKRVALEGELALFDIRQQYIGTLLPQLENIRQPVVYNFEK